MWVNGIKYIYIKIFFQNAFISHIWSCIVQQLCFPALPKPPLPTILDSVSVKFRIYLWNHTAYAFKYCSFTQNNTFDNSFVLYWAKWFASWYIYWVLFFSCIESVFISFLMEYVLITLSPLYAPSHHPFHLDSHHSFLSLENTQAPVE